jgi:hypothetical protein
MAEIKITKRIVYKYNLGRCDTIMDLPVDHKVVLVAMQGDSPRIWIEMDTPEGITKSEFIFRILPTGTEFYYGTHVGSFMECGGALIWHVYRIAL